MKQITSNDEDDERKPENQTAEKVRRLVSDVVNWLSLKLWTGVSYPLYEMIISAYDGSKSETLILGVS